MLLLAAFEVLLHRLTGQEDIVVGAPIAGRTLSETERIVGLFLNVVVLKTGIHQGMTFEDVLSAVREATVSAYAHQDVPFEKLVEVLRPGRSLKEHPLFEVMFNYLNVPAATHGFKTVEATRLPVPENRAKLPLTLYVEENARSIQVRAMYRVSQFSEAQVSCLLWQYRYLLEQIVVDSRRTIGAYSLIAPETVGQLHDPTAAIAQPLTRPVTQLFSEIATRQPNWPAVRKDGRTWSYSQLLDSAQRIAGTLLASGMTAGEVVAIEGPRSFGVIASMMGILMARGVMLTLDRSLPPQRRKLMLEQAKAGYLIQVLSTAGDPPQEDYLLPSLQRIAVDANTGKPTIERGPSDPVLDDPHPADSAYLFFTSGTTGIPKAVLGSHKGLSHFLAWERSQFAIGTNDRVSQLTGFSFDVILRDVFLPLTSGACLCLPPHRAELDPTIILEWLITEGITVLHVVPSLANSWLQHQADASRTRKGGPRLVLFAGEPLTDVLVDKWRAQFSATAAVVNLYGPTETTLAKFFYQVPKRPERGVQPVGHPLPETQALVLRPDRQLCGIGESGQIAIRTPYRSLGYLNATELEDAKFQPNPFTEDRNDLLYFSGDVGYYRADGLLQITGRLDDQLKIRGIRVEPDEVASQLEHHPGVQQAVVIGRENPSGEKQLIAYVVVNRGRDLPISELRAFLKARLPEYMVPARFHLMESLPTTPNGKVDRAKLPAPESEHAIDVAADVAPSDGIEMQLSLIWEEILGVHPIGLYDNFFDLGGHSLLAARLFAEIAKKMGRRLPLATLFEAQNIKQLAAALQRVSGAPTTDLAPIQTRGTLPPLFCIPGILGEPFIFYALSRCARHDRPWYGFQYAKAVQSATGQDQFRQIAASLVAEVKSVQPQGPYHLLGYSMGGTMAMEMATQLLEQGDDIAFLGLLDSSGPGYPRILPAPIRAILHLRHALSLPPNQRWNFIRTGWRNLKYRAARKVPLRPGEAADSATREAERRIEQAVYEARMKYVLRFYPGHVTLFRSSIKPSGMGADYSDPLSGWASRVGSLDVRAVPGSHDTFLSQPHVQVLARELQSCLDAITVNRA